MDAIGADAVGWLMGYQYGKWFAKKILMVNKICFYQTYKYFS